MTPLTDNLKKALTTYALYVRWRAANDSKKWADDANIVDPAFIYALCASNVASVTQSCITYETVIQTFLSCGAVGKPFYRVSKFEVPSGKTLLAMDGLNLSLTGIGFCMEETTCEKRHCSRYALHVRFFKLVTVLSLFPVTISRYFCNNTLIRWTSSLHAPAEL